MANGALDSDTIEVHQYAKTPSLVFTCVDENGTAINLSGATLELNVFDISNTTIFDLTTGASEITIGGASNNVVTCTFTSTETGTAGNFRYELRQLGATNRPLARGPFIIHASPNVWS